MVLEFCSGDETIFYIETFAIYSILHGRLPMSISTSSLPKTEIRVLKLLAEIVENTTTRSCWLTSRSRWPLKLRNALLMAE